ncbi:hypothetical protein ACF8Q9_08205 [Pseudomonas sp. TYF_15]|uniref:hypothetical protein n=1 Tax=Pseudomonas sp. TYF_15 TaxID=3367194 RepID=UPI00370BB969
MSSGRRDDRAAHSKSIQLTLSDVDKILEGTDLPKAGKLRRKLHAVLINAFNEKGAEWYQKGFNRGHVETQKAFNKKGRFPKKLQVTKERKFTPSSEKISVELYSEV